MQTETQSSDLIVHCWGGLPQVELSPWVAWVERDCTDSPCPMGESIWELPASLSYLGGQRWGSSDHSLEGLVWVLVRILSGIVRVSWACVSLW